MGEDYRFSRPKRPLFKTKSRMNFFLPPHVVVGLIRCCLAIRKTEGSKRPEKGIDPLLSLRSISYLRRKEVPR